MVLPLTLVETPTKIIGSMIRASVQPEKKMKSGTVLCWYDFSGREDLLCINGVHILYRVHSEFNLRNRIVFRLLWMRDTSVEVTVEAKFSCLMTTKRCVSVCCAACLQEQHFIHPHHVHVHFENNNVIAPFVVRLEIFRKMWADKKKSTEYDENDLGSRKYYENGGEWRRNMINYGQVENKFPNLMYCRTNFAFYGAPQKFKWNYTYTLCVTIFVLFFFFFLSFIRLFAPILSPLSSVTGCAAAHACRR